MSIPNVPEVLPPMDQATAARQTFIDGPQAHAILALAGSMPMDFRPVEHPDDLFKIVNCLAYYDGDPTIPVLDREFLETAEIYADCGLRTELSFGTKFRNGSTRTKSSTRISYFTDTCLRFLSWISTMTE